MYGGIGQENESTKQNVNLEKKSCKGKKKGSKIMRYVTKIQKISKEMRDIKRTIDESNDPLFKSSLGVTYATMNNRIDKINQKMIELGNKDVSDSTESSDEASDI